MTATPDDLDIAASYSRRDSAVVVPLLDALKARGVRVWFDKNIPGGALWEETITRNLRRAKAVIFFVSRQSLESDRCFDEVSAARTLRKPIVPVLVERLSMPDDLPDRLILTLQTRNTIDAFPGAEGDPVEQLIQALGAFGVKPGVAAAVADAAPPPPERPALAGRGRMPPAGPRDATKRRAVLGVGAATALIVAVLAATGVLGGASSSPTGQIAATEWCGLSAPALLAKGAPGMDAAALAAAAERGDLDAQTLYCLSANPQCTGGDDRGVDMQAAFGACVKAGEQGRWRAVFNQGWLRQRGCGAPVDGKAAAFSYTRAAEAGCAIAQFQMGVLHETGELVPMDFGQTIRWLTAAADQSYPPALNRLGAMYALGKGVPEDDARGVELYRRAADLGDARAMLNYASALERGMGVERNTGAAIAYYRRAAAQTADAEIKRLAQDALKRLGADQ